MSAIDLSPYFKSIIDQDPMEVVICDLNNDIIYMNPAAIEFYDEDTGAGLIGRSIMDCHPHWANLKIDEVVKWFSESKDHNVVHTAFNERRNMDFYMVALRDENGELIGYYEKHESRNKESMPFYRM